MVLKTVSDIMEIAQARKRLRSVAVAAAHDDHTLEAVIKAKKDGFVNPFLVGDQKKIEAILEAMGESLGEGQIIDAQSPEECARLSVKLVKEGRAEFLMKGILNTADILRAVLNKDTGLPHGKVVTHLALTELPGYHKLVGLNDCAILPYPTLEQKIAQVQAVTEAMHSLGYGDDLKIGAIAAAETLNPKIIESAEAAELKRLNQRGRISGCIIEGPISLDLALDTKKATVKGYDNPVAGNVDALIFPNLISGNVYAKAVEMMGATPVGIILGASVPICCASRAASTAIKYYSLVATSVTVK